MRVKPVKWRRQARDDAMEAAYWYAQQGGLSLGEQFLSAVDTTLSTLARFPASGSSRHADAMIDLPAPLRFVVVQQFERYLAYYLDLPTHVEVLRIWNAARGLQALFDSTTDPDREPS